MSILWSIRIVLIGFFYVYILIYAILLKDRQRFSKILENMMLNIFLVIIYNVCCYLSVLLPPDLGFLNKPIVLEGLFIIIWYNVFAILLYLLGGSLLILTLKMRKVIGAQDTEGKLLTNNLYSFCRHPIYLGISLISLGISLSSVNLDAMIIIPMIFLGNYLTGTIEEKYDINQRFGEEYQEYKKKVQRFGPLWFWFLLAILIMLPIIINSFMK